MTTIPVLGRYRPYFQQITVKVTHESGTYLSKPRAMPCTDPGWLPEQTKFLNYRFWKGPRTFSSMDSQNHLISSNLVNNLTQSAGFPQGDLKILF